MIQLYYRYRIEGEDYFYNGTHLVELEGKRDSPNNDWNIIEDLLDEKYKDDDATIKLLWVERNY